MFFLIKPYFTFSRYVVARAATAEGPSERSTTDQIIKKVILFVLVLLLFSSVLTTAQPATPPIPQRTTDALIAFSQIGDSIQTGLDNLRGSGAAAGGVMGLGMMLFGFFFVVNTVWALMKGMITGSGLSGFFADFVPDMIAAGIVLVFLTQDIGKAIESAINGLASTITGNLVSNLSSLINEAAAQALQTISNIWNAPSVSSANSSMWATLTTMPLILYAIIAKGIAILFLLVAFCFYLGILVMSQVSVSIALILAPVFIPFLMFKPAGFLFDGWLRFFLGAGMMKVVGLLMLMITSVMMGVLETISISAIASNTGVGDAFSIDVVVYGSMILLSTLSAIMMASVPSIAAGLISGAGSGAGFGGFSSLIRSPSNQMITGGMGSKGGGGGGAKGPGGSSAGNAFSGLTNNMPNVVKPFTTLAGAGLSKAGGFLAAGSAMRAAKKVGGFGIGRDLSKMSASTASSYINRLEKVNARRSDLQFGPPAPSYTVSKPTSSTTPGKSTG